MKYVILIIVSLFVISCGAGKDEADKQRFLIKGNDALLKHEHKEALRYYTEALKIDSCYADALNNIGIVQYENGNYSEAVLNYDAAIHCNPEFWDGYLNRANAYYELNELYRSLDDLEYLQKKIPDSASVYFGLGLVQTKRREYDKAIKAFNQALLLDSGNAEVLVNRGTVYYYQDKFDQALENLNEAITVDPKEANAYNALALLKSDQGELDEALALIEMALKIEAFQPYFMNNRGYIRMMMQDSLAVEDINKAIVLDPKNGWAYRNKAIWYMNKGQYNKAITLLDRAEELDDFIDLLFYYKGICYSKMDKMEAACKVWGVSSDRGEQESIAKLKTDCQ